MSEDISKNTLLVLVVLTIVISLLGTWTVINEAARVGISDQSIQPKAQSSVSEGRVAINVVGEPEPVTATGKVILEIV